MVEWPTSGYEYQRMSNISHFTGTGHGTRTIYHKTFGNFGDGTSNVYQPQTDCGVTRGGALECAEKEVCRFIEKTTAARGSTIVDLFREQAEATPRSIAIESENESMSYERLDRLSDIIAARLIGEGLQPEEVVSLLLDRSIEFVVATLGVLKAGGSCLPLDFDLPDQFLSFMISDTGSRIMIAKGGYLDRFRECFPVPLCIEEFFSALPTHALNAERVNIAPSQRAYVIYTSGSTGTPKGVELEHRSICSLVTSWNERFGMSSNDRAALTSNVSFDAILTDLWPPLCAGATVLVPPRDLFLHHDPDGLIGWLRDMRATIAFAVSGVIPKLLHRAWPEDMNLRYLITAGDALRHRPPEGFPCVFVNGYGPTENTVASTLSDVSHEGADSPPIGYALGGVKTYVLNDDLSPVPAGLEGELYLGGDQVARGYLNLPDLTSERFLTDPFTLEPNRRMYRTGDWVRVLPDGQLEFLGRRDDQIQLNGIRIELEGISRTLLCHPDVRDACCRPIMEGGLCRHLVAHVVPLSERTGLHDLLQRFLMERLPLPSVPTAFFFHEELPMNARGKIDRASLDTKPIRCFPSGSNTGFDRPFSPVRVPPQPGS
jgi:amino acid adenylation domain-containing protein